MAASPLMSGAQSDMLRSWKLLSTSSRKMVRAEFQNERYVGALGSTIDTFTSTSPTLTR